MKCKVKDTVKIIMILLKGPEDLYFSGPKGIESLPQTHIF